MIKELQIRVLPEQAADEQSIREYLSKEYAVSPESLTAVRVLKRSVDARQRTIYVNLKVRMYVNEQPQDDEYQHTDGERTCTTAARTSRRSVAAIRLTLNRTTPLARVEQGHSPTENSIHAARNVATWRRF